MKVVILAGGFGQWKYFCTDDSVLRGTHLGNINYNEKL